MVHCSVIGGELTTTQEAIELGYFDPSQIPPDEWHKDAEGRVEAAVRWWQTHMSGSQIK